MSLGMARLPRRQPRLAGLEVEAGGDEVGAHPGPGDRGGLGALCLAVEESGGTAGAGARVVLAFRERASTWPTQVPRRQSGIPLLARRL